MSKPQVSLDPDLPAWVRGKPLTLTPLLWRYSTQVGRAMAERHPGTQIHSARNSGI